MSAGLAIVGSGRVSLSLATALASQEDLSVTVVGRRGRRPEFLEDFELVRYVSARAPEDLGEEPFAAVGADAGVHTDLIFCVSDDALAQVAGAWCAAAGAVLPRAVLHTSGVDSADALACWRDRGIPVAAWHPIVAVAEPRPGALRGVWFGVDGDAEARRIGSELARRLDGRTLDVRPEQRSRYHTAAVFASNFLVACLRVALDELRSASEDAELDILLPLAESALRNLGRLGLSQGATGPVTRGDVQTIASNLAVLDPRRASVYRGLGLELLELTGDRLGPDVRDELAALFRDAEPGREAQDAER